jgi:hypothetical protein
MIHAVVVSLLHTNVVSVNITSLWQIFVCCVFAHSNCAVAQHPAGSYQDVSPASAAVQHISLVTSILDPLCIYSLLSHIQCLLLLCPIHMATAHMSICWEPAFIIWCARYQNGRQLLYIFSSTANK